VRIAVESAENLPEVAEILLIEDGSLDHSLEVCKVLEKEFSKVKLFSHLNGENRGSGASRNLGIENASSEYISFLDADDYYLPNRFEAEKKIFEKEPDIDGVYGALGFHYYTPKGEKKYKQASFGDLTILNGRPEPNELFLSLIWLHPQINGNFSIVALTVKKASLIRNNLKFGQLKMHEDTILILQLSLCCKLKAGIIDVPVALRGVHDNNRIVNNLNVQSRLLMWRELHEWAKCNGQSKSIIKQFNAFKVTEELKIKRGFSQIGIWFVSSLTNKYYLTNYNLFTNSTKMVFGNKLGNSICFVKERVQAMIFKKKLHFDINV
jgi:glycosyltransferase involved in cell wall biosynthesis